MDLFNKAALQPRTLPTVWKTNKCHKRLFAYSWGCIETNAQIAYNRYSQGLPLTKMQWYNLLSDACRNNPFSPPKPRAGLKVQGHGGPKQDKHGQCWVCFIKTKWKCSYGRPECGLSTRAKTQGGDKPQPLCYKEHLAAVFDNVPGHSGPVM